MRRTDAQVGGWARGECEDGGSVLSALSPGLYQELHLEELTVAELTGKLAEMLGLPVGQILQVSRQGPSGIHILVSDTVRTRGCPWWCQTLQPSLSLRVLNLLPARLSPSGCPSL